MTTNWTIRLPCSKLSVQELCLSCNILILQSVAIDDKTHSRFDVFRLDSAAFIRWPQLSTVCKNLQLCPAIATQRKRKGCIVGEAGDRIMPLFISNSHPRIHTAPRESFVEF